MDWNWIELNESFGRICSYKFHINVCECILHVQFGWFATCHCIYLKQKKTKILIKITRIEDEQVKAYLQFKEFCLKFCQNDLFWHIAHLDSILNKTLRLLMLHDGSVWKIFKQNSWVRIYFLICIWNLFTIFKRLEF